MNRPWWQALPTAPAHEAAMHYECEKCGVKRNKEEFYPFLIKNRKLLIKNTRFWCRECYNSYHREWNKKNSEKLAVYRKKWTSKVRSDSVRLARFNARRREYCMGIKRKAFEALGGQCACCCEAQFEFLQIDHINNDGAEHRKRLGIKLGVRSRDCTQLIYLEIIDGNIDGLQVLCANCNWGKARNGGICPHVENRLRLASAAQ